MTIICRDCGHSWFKEESQLEQLDGATKITKRFICCFCSKPLDANIPRSEYTLREYESGQMNLKQEIIQTALSAWRSPEPTNVCVSNDVTNKEFMSTLQTILTEHQEIVAALESLRKAIISHDEEPETHTYEVSYQQEAFPWDRWSIAETTKRTHPLHDVYKDHSSGITEVLCVLVEADSRLDAKIAGGTILMEYMKKANDEQYT